MNKTLTVPPFAKMVLRTDKEFTVLSSGKIIGPDSSTARSLRVETAGESLEIEVEYKGKLSVEVNVRNPHEENDGVPVAVTTEVSPPTIQEMMRMYLAEELHRHSDEIETPDEFFDFEMDDDGELLRSDYEFDDMVEEYPLPKEGDSQESPTGQAENGDQETESTPDDPPFESRRDSLDTRAPAGS